MTYDDWKTQEPDSFELEEDNHCLFCGVSIQDSERYCSTSCRNADIDERC